MPLSDTVTREVSRRADLNMEKLTAGLAGDWPGYVRDWDRTLRVANHPETIRYNYLLAAVQLARYLDEHSPDPEAISAAEDPTTVRKAHVESFLAWMIETRSASTALNKYKGLQQFFRWLLEDEEAIDRSPMERVRQLRVGKKLVPIMRDDDTTSCCSTGKPTPVSRPGPRPRARRAGKGCGQASRRGSKGPRISRFSVLRDEALMRMYYNTAGRLSEVANGTLDDLDLKAGSQLRSRNFVNTLRRNGLRGSMGRVGACGDNAATESFLAFVAEQRPGPATVVHSRGSSVGDRDLDRTDLPPPTSTSPPRSTHPDRV